jgi:hypothetical protein
MASLVLVVSELETRVVFTSKSSVAHSGIAPWDFAEGPCLGGSHDMCARTSIVHTIPTKSK